MKLSTVKDLLQNATSIYFKLPDGNLVPSHFHVTEVGKVSKHFIDCGGKERTETKVNFQLWSSDDYDHRLHPEKLLSIIQVCESKLDIGDHEVEVEYQGETIGKYGLDHDGSGFVLVSMATQCLAQEACGIPEPTMIPLGSGVCTPGGGCC